MEKNRKRFNEWRFFWEWFLQQANPKDELDIIDERQFDNLANERLQKRVSDAKAQTRKSDRFTKTYFAIQGELYDRQLRRS